MRTFLVLYKKRKYFTKASHPQLEAVKNKFSLDVNISCVMQETKIFHQGPPPQLKDLRKKFSLDGNFSCVMQETKIFHLDGGRFKEEILCRCENFLCYARNKNFSQRPPPPLTISVTILYFPYRKSRGSIRRWKI